MPESNNTRVIACSACAAPVLHGIPTCPSCGASLHGKESPYVLQRHAGADVAGLVKWWVVWSLLIWVLAGFSMGITSSLLFTGLTCFYLLRIVRAYFD